MLETRQFEGAVEVGNIFGIPPHKLGDRSRAGYNGLTEENQAFLDDGLDPWLCGWEEEAGDKLCTAAEEEADSHYFEFDRDALLRTDTVGRYRAYQIGRTNGWLNGNQICAMENLDAMGPQGDIYLVPANMVDLSKLPDPSQKPAAGSAGRADPNIVETHRALFQERLERLAAVEVNQVREAARRKGNFVRWLDDFYSKHELRMVEALAPALRAYFAVVRRSGADDVAGDAARSWCARAKTDVLEAAGSATAEALAGQVERSVSAWGGHRVDELVEGLLEGGTDDAVGSVAA
jgi:hypothetical protein